LMDIKRVAFETRPVKSTRPAVVAQKVSAKSQTATQPEITRVPEREPAVATGKINRQEISAIVDRFLAGRHVEGKQTPSPLPRPQIEAEAGSMYAGPSGRTADNGAPRGNRGSTAPIAEASTNGRKAIDFVSEDDVRRALQKGEKIYINARTIITPAARDIGDPAEVFAKV